MDQYAVNEEIEITVLLELGTHRQYYVLSISVVTISFLRWRQFYTVYG